MSLSNLCFEQHECDQTRLQKLLLWGLLGSMGGHAVAFGLSHLNLWPQASEAKLSPIELIVMEPSTKPVEEPDVLDPVEPAKLSTETNDPAPAPAAPATPSKAAVVAALRPEPIAVPEVVEPEPSEVVEPEPIPETEVESEVEVPEEAEEELEEDTPEAQLPPEEVEETEAEAEPTESDLATAPEDSSQLDRLRDFFQRQREGEADNGEVAVETPSTGEAEAAEPSSEPAGSGEAATTAARPGSGTSETTSPAGGGNAQGQGSRTVACQNCVRPEYPESALEAGAEGQPMVSVDINPDGSIRSVTLTRSSGNPAIDQAAIQAARNSRFQPVNGGASVPIEYDLTIEGSRRNREAQRRGERQFVEVPSEPSPTPEAASSEPAPATTVETEGTDETPEARSTPPSSAASELEPTETESQPDAEEATQPGSESNANPAEPQDSSEPASIPQPEPDAVPSNPTPGLQPQPEPAASDSAPASPPATHPASAPTTPAPDPEPIAPNLTAPVVPTAPATPPQPATVPPVEPTTPPAEAPAAEEES
jgi:TonB family protein